MCNILKVFRALFMDSARINRKVILSILKKIAFGKQLFLEIGPGEVPLLDLLDIEDNQKCYLDLPGMFPVGRLSGVRYIEQNAGTDSWDLNDESVDVLVSSQCLEHIPDTDHFISEANRVLKKGGILILSVPNQGALVFILMLLLTINPTMNEVSNRFIGLGNPFSTNRYKKRENYHGYTHLRLFTTRAMDDLIKVYGFEVMKNHGATFGIPLIGEFLAKIFPYYGLFTIVMAKKARPLEL